MRGGNSARQTPSRSRQQDLSSPEWDGSKPYGYQPNSSNRNQHKNNAGSNHNSSSSSSNHNKNYNDSDNKELLDKFEALGRERRGDAVSSYRVTNTYDDSVEPEWLDPTDETNDDLPASGHSIEEFEEWKAKMKADERRRAGLSDVPVDDSPTLVNPPESTMFDSADLNVGHKSVDKLFGMWDTTPHADQNNFAAVGRASRFSRFFKGDSAPPSPGGAAPPGLTQQPQPQPQNPSNLGSPVNSFTSANSPVLVQPAPSDSHSGNEADRQGFMRIMAMLGDNPGEEQHSPSPTVDTTKPVEQTEAPPSDDAFFLSLLNKGTTSNSSSGPNSIPQASPAISSRSPAISRDSPIAPRGMIPGVSTPQPSMGKSSVTPQKEQFLMDPYFQGAPPPEWVQQQIANDQFPANGIPPGFIPPPFMGAMPMPPPGMLPQFPPGQNGMPPLPPHMMPPMGNFYNAPPPPMNFPMHQQFPQQQQQLNGTGNGNGNGKFSPGIQGLQLPPYGIVQNNSDRRFEGHKVN